MHYKFCSVLPFKTAKGREASFNSGRLSFFSSTCEEGEAISREALKTYTCLSEAPQTLADGLLDLEEKEIEVSPLL